MDVSLVDTIVSACCTDMMRHLKTGKTPERMGNRYAPLAPYDSFHAIDWRIHHRLRQPKAV